ncbi:hypothetical protein AB3662_26335 [Sorangium cellulosum]|uniref:hypothetical protein n=1 Tax=Sorangium cellulosum TaxID=56 RepID=UPI003D9A1A3F
MAGEPGRSSLLQGEVRQAVIPARRARPPHACAILHKNSTRGSTKLHERLTPVTRRVS